jgi:UDP-2-acetamido-3-amino-2,3-dideoxy-glucuronate N-acetyltransferase
MMFHPKALVDDASWIGADTKVWAYAHVMAGARVGSNCNIGDHAFVEAGAIVGNNVTLKNNVFVCEGITIEDDVFVGPGAVFTNDSLPRSRRMPGAAGRYVHKANSRNVDPYTLVVGSPARFIQHVCGCGQKLAGHYSETDCHVCGETGAERRRIGVSNVSQ